MRALVVALLAPCCAALAVQGAVRPTTGRRLSPVTCLSEESPVLSRRCMLVLGPISLLAPQVARADEDALLGELRKVRTQLSGEATGVAVLVQTREWDEVRTQVRRALSLLTMKGYLGASVKSRILALPKALLSGRASMTHGQRCCKHSAPWTSSLSSSKSCRRCQSKPRSSTRPRRYRPCRPPSMDWMRS